MIAVPRGGKQAGGLDERTSAELSGFRGAGVWLGQRVRRRVVAELMSGELAVECRHIFGSGGIPFGSELGFASGLGGAAAPIGGARFAPWCRRTGQNSREMLEGERRVLKKAQRDIAR